MYIFEIYGSERNKTNKSFCFDDNNDCALWSWLSKNVFKAKYITVNDIDDFYRHKYPRFTGKMAWS